MVRRSLAFVFALTLLHCGGKTADSGDGGNGADGGACPSDLTQACTSGEQCSAPSLCGSSTCSCSGGHWACPAGVCVEACPVDVTQGTACGAQGLACQSADQPKCTNVPVTCTCDGTEFQCAVPDCAACPLQITPGAPCSFPADATCPVDLVVCGTEVSTTAFCQNGVWSLELTSDCDAGAPLDAGAD